MVAWSILLPAAAEREGRKKRSLESDSISLRFQIPALLSALLLTIMIAAVPVRADIVLLKDGKRLEAHIDDVDREDASYLLILPDGSDMRVAIDDVATIVEKTTLDILEKIVGLEERARKGDEKVLAEIVGIRTKYPKIGSRVRARLATSLRSLGKRWAGEGDQERAFDAYRAALSYLPGDKESLEAIKSLRRVTGTAPRLSVRTYFPIQPGARWTYEEEGGVRVVRVSSVKALEDGVVEAEVEESRDLKRLEETKRYSWVLDADGIRRVGERAGPLLKEPVEVGTSWSERTELVIYTWEYVALGEEVVVGGRTYSDCLKVRIRAKPNPYEVDPVIIYRYFARGVGLVKTEWANGQSQVLKEYRIEE